MSHLATVDFTINKIHRCRIADSLPGRTNKDCRKRWHNSVAGGLKKGQWSKSEDQLLSRGVQQHGQKYGSVKHRKYQS
jgi:hypothetical protein